MKWRLVAVIAVLFAARIVPAAAAAVPAARSESVGAGAALVMEVRTGRVLFGQSADEELPIASTTKIMTALLALEQPDIDAVFPVDDLAIIVEGSSMGLQKGDRASLRALAAGMLLSSGNDAANAAAVRIAGSIPAFVARMNRRAAELGLSRTHFVTPSGLDAEGHYSTARDLATLARAALANDEFVAICSQYRLRTSYGNPPYDRWLTNHNRLLNTYDGAFGVKTGFTKKAGRCLVSAASRDGIELICVTLDCPDDWTVHKALYDRYFGELEVADLAEMMPPLRVPVTGGTAAYVRAEAAEGMQVPVPRSGADVMFSVKLEQFLYAPVLSGRYLGEATVTVDGAEVAVLTLTAASDVPPLVEYREKKTLAERIASFFGP